MKREQAAEEYMKKVVLATRPLYATIAKGSFLAGWDAKAKQDEERIKELEEKLQQFEGCPNEEWECKKIQRGLENKLKIVVEALTEYADEWSGLYRPDISSKIKSAHAKTALTKIRGEEK